MESSHSQHNLLSPLHLPMYLGYSRLSSAFTQYTLIGQFPSSQAPLETSRPARNSSKMPARKMVTLKVSPSKLRTLTFNAEFVEFAKRSLEETFLAYVDQVTDKNPSHASSSAGSSFSSVGNSTTGTVAASPQHGNAHSEDDEDEEYNAIEHATSRWTSTQPSSSSENEPKQSFAHRSRTIPSFASSSEDADMPENNNNTTTNQQPAAGAESGGGQPFYEEQRKKLQKLLERRILAKKKLVSYWPFVSLFDISSWPHLSLAITHSTQIWLSHY